MFESLLYVGLPTILALIFGIVCAVANRPNRKARVRILKEDRLPVKYGQNWGIITFLHQLRLAILFVAVAFLGIAY